MKIMMKKNSITEIVKGAHNDSQHQKSAQPKTRPIDFHVVQLTDAWCHLVPISILWYRLLNYTIEIYIWNQPGKITVSYHPAHNNGHTNFWYACLLEKAYFNNFRVQRQYVVCI